MKRLSNLFNETYCVSNGTININENKLIELVISLSFFSLIPISDTRMICIILTAKEDDDCAFIAVKMLNAILNNDYTDNVEVSLINIKNSIYNNDKYFEVDEWVKICYKEFLGNQLYILNDDTRILITTFSTVRVLKKTTIRTIEVKMPNIKFYRFKVEKDRLFVEDNDERYELVNDDFLLVNKKYRSHYCKEITDRIYALYSDNKLFAYIDNSFIYSFDDKEHIHKFIPNINNDRVLSLRPFALSENLISLPGDKNSYKKVFIKIIYKSICRKNYKERYLLKLLEHKLSKKNITLNEIEKIIELLKKENVLIKSRLKYLKQFNKIFIKLGFDFEDDLTYVFINLLEDIRYTINDGYNDKYILNKKVINQLYCLIEKLLAEDTITIIKKRYLLKN